MLFIGELIIQLAEVGHSYTWTSAQKSGLKFMQDRKYFCISVCLTLPSELSSQMNTISVHCREGRSGEGVNWTGHPPSCRLPRL